MDDKSEADGGGGDDDPPAQIPDGFKQVDWQPGQTFQDFMLWTSVGASRASWHQGVVAKVLGANRRDGFTHDAKLDGTSDIRGVPLTAALHAEGIWICLARGD